MAAQIPKLMDQFEMTCLIVDTGKNLILTDTGWGLGWTPGSGKLIDKLQTIGFSCSDINTVIHTHAHPDHIGGNTFADSTPVFPNARYVICKNEWDYWTSGPDLRKLDNEIKQTILKFFEKNLLNIRDHLDIVDNDAEIIPGIRCIKTPGHTPGHTAFVFSSGDYQIISCGDAVHQPFQLLKPEWSMSGDFNFEYSIDSRIRIFDHASRSNSILFACHFPFPGVGTVERHGDVWLWNPY